MADSKEVNRLAKEVVAALTESCSIEVLWRVWRTLPDGVDFFNNEKLMPLEVVLTGDDDDDDDDRELDGFECPHCFTVLPYDEVKLVDMDVRVIDAHNVSYENSELWYSYDDDNFDDVARLCGSCGLPIALPPGWTSEWS